MPTFAAMAELETVTIAGVEILAAGGPVHGVGSPPEGDHWTTDDLRGMAEAAQELEAAGEWRPAVKIGHSDQQALLNASVTPGEMPAAGWLTNQRVSDDGTKLLADLADVPRKLADLIKAKAYRTRSSELSKITSQTTGKSYPWVASGLALLGGKMPAVRTLDDIVALYEGDEATRMFTQFDDVEAPSNDELRDAIAAVGLQAAREFSDDVARERAAADIRRGMSDTKTYTAEQRKTFADATGLDEANVTDEMLANAAKLFEAVAPDPKQDPDPDPDPKGGDDDDAARALEARMQAAEEKIAASEKRAFEAERKHVIESALREGRFTPGEREGWEKRYEVAPDATVEAIQKLPADDDLGREYGSADTTELDAGPDSRLNEAHEAHLVQLTGSKEGLL